MQPCFVADMRGCDTEHVPINATLHPQNHASIMVSFVYIFAIYVEDNVYGLMSVCECQAFVMGAISMCYYYACARYHCTQLANASGKTFASANLSGWMPDI